MRALPTISAAAALALALTGCATVHRSESPQSGPSTVVVAKHKGKKHGPPPHAPAHGYRYHHREDDVDLVYDNRLQAYRVAGHDHCYYADGVYFRYSGRGWEMAASWTTEWGRVSIERVPLSLRTRER